MKKNTLLLLSFCAILVAASQVGGRQATDDNAATGIAFLVSMNGDFSDLDARDIQNQPITAPSAVQELVTLFRENLIDLMVLAGPHQTAAALAWLDSISHLFNNTILKTAMAVWDLFQDAIMTPIRRFVHNVNNLCTTFSVGVLSGCLMLSTFNPPKFSQNFHLRI